MKYSLMCSCSWNVKNALPDVVVLTAPFNSKYRFPLDGCRLVCRVVHYGKL